MIPDEVEANRARTLAQRDDPPPLQRGPERDHRGEAVQECAHPDCTRLSVNEITRDIGPVAARRWHCPEHETITYGVALTESGPGHGWPLVGIARYIQETIRGDIQNPMRALFAYE